MAHRQPFDRHGISGAGFRQAQRDEHQHQQRIADQEPERRAPAEGFGEQATEQRRQRWDDVQRAVKKPKARAASSPFRRSRTPLKATTAVQQTATLAADAKR